MKTDERDHRLAELMDGAARSTTATDRFERVLKRGGRRRAIRWTAIVAGLALFVGVVMWTGLSLRANRAEWSTYAAANDKWTLSYPAAWHVTKIADKCTYRGYRGGVIIASVDFPFRTPHGSLQDCGQRYILAGFPTNGVAFAIEPAFLQGTGAPFFREPDTAFPLTPTTLFGDGAIRGGPRETMLGITINGETIYVVRAWVGSSVTASDQAALDRVVSSLNFVGAPRWITRSPQHGLTVSYPENWYFAPGNPKAHGVVQQIFALSTERPPFTNENFACTRTQAGLLVVDEVPSSMGRNYPARPAQFGSRPADKTNRFCTGWSHKEWKFRFRDSGRYIDATIGVVIGDAGDLRSTALRVLNGLRFER